MANSIGKGKIIGLVIILIIAAGLYYLYTSYGSIPSSLLSVVASGKQVNSTVLTNLVLQKVNSQPMVSMNYTGSITVTNDPPFSVSFLKYYNDTRTTYSFNGLPIVGTAQVTVISLNNGATGYVCVNSQNSQLFSAYGSECVPSTSYNYTSLYGALGKIVKLSSLSNVGLSGYGLSSYNGQPCLSVSGKGTIDINSTIANVVSSSGYVPSNLSFSTCFSNQYNIPLTLSALMSVQGGASINVTLQQQSIGFSTSESEVTSLPSNVVG